MNSTITDVQDARLNEGEIFTKLLDLGEIVVPSDYDQVHFFEHFFRLHGGNFRNFNPKINDANFGNPSYSMKPGERFRVSVFGQNVSSGVSDSRERLKFLNENDVICLGAQGAALVFDQKRVQLQANSRYISFDLPDRLWLDDDLHPRLPILLVSSSDEYFFRLGHFGSLFDFEEDFFGFKKI